MASGLVGHPHPPALVKAEAYLQPVMPGVPTMQPCQMPAAAVRLEAYKKVMKIFMQGSYDLAKEDALASLRSALAISEQEHLSVRAAAMADTQHLLQLNPAPGSQEMSVGHSSQPLGAAGLPGSGGTTPVEAMLGAAQAQQPGGGGGGGSRAAGGSSAAGAGVKRATPSTTSKAAAAAPRKRNRTAAGSTAGGAAGGAGDMAPSSRARTGPAAPAPRASAGQDLDPLVGRVVLRNWPRDGGWFSGIISDFRPQTGEHCIIYDMGKPSESFEWYNIRAASPEDCQVKEERVDFATLSLPPAAGSAAGAAAAATAAAPKGSRPPAAAAANGSARSGGGGGGAAGAKQQGGGSCRQQPAAARQGAGASKAGASRAATAGSKAAAVASKPAAARSAAAAAKPAATASLPQQQQQQMQVQAPAAPPAAPQQQPARQNGKTTTHHAHLANGLSSHAAAVKQVLAAGGRPPSYLNGHALLPRRTRSWSSDEDDSDDSDDE